jgi:hypothetical protein
MMDDRHPEEQNSPDYPYFAPGTWVHAADRENYGEVTEDRGTKAAQATVHFHNQ